MAEFALTSTIVSNWINMLTGITTLLLAIEIFRLFGFFRRRREHEKVVEKMERGRVPEGEAEREVADEEKAREKERDVVKLALDEFILLKRMVGEVNNASSTKEFLERAQEKILDLNREERIENKLTRRLQDLYDTAKKIADEEPPKRNGIYEAWTVIYAANRQLIHLVSRGGRFEYFLNLPLSASYSEQMKADSLKIVLARAIKHVEEMEVGLKKMDEVLKSE